VTGYTANDAFTAPEIYDLSDLVQGGANGDANTPIKALADQANYLNNRLWRWQGVKTITGSYNMDPVADLGQYMLFGITANATVVLPDAGALLDGTRIAIHAQIWAVKSLTILTQNTQPIYDGSISWVTWDTNRPGIYMHDAEKLVLIACTNHYKVESAIGNFYSYGESFGARIQRGNTLIANGSVYNRADLPRLALLVENGGTCVTSDSTWGSDPGGVPEWRGLFSTGNGSTTLRVPDERALSDRYLDLGRNLDLYRYPNVPGGFEDEQVGTHDHATHGKGGITGAGLTWFLSRLFGGRYAGGGSDTFGGSSSGPDTTMRTSDNSGSQNIVKNLGKIPLIRY
jgi:hypothetical protein